MMPPDTWRLHEKPLNQELLRWPVQELDKIRLNLASVDQFLSIACGLGDDNPEIRFEVYEAAREAREASLLIDHLRSLFNRQLQLVELEQLQLQADKIRQVSHYDENLRQNIVNRDKQQPLTLSFHDRHTLAEKSRQFSYSNRLALVRAAKSLVSNVAKILYLTDLVALQCCRHQSTATKFHPSSGSPSSPSSSHSSSHNIAKQHQQQSSSASKQVQVNRLASNCHQSNCSSHQSAYHQPAEQKVSRLYERIVRRDCWIVSLPYWRRPEAAQSPQLAA